MGKGSKRYINQIKNLVDWIMDKQLDKIDLASKVLTKAVKEKNTIWAFGCTHSSILTAEIFYRAGGLSLINGIFPPGMWLDEIPVTKTSRIENMSGYAEIIVDERNIKENDLIFLFSTSGRNNVPIEMALETKKRGAYIIAITSLKYSQQVSSRHESGKKLYELADIVIDNGAEKGDAAIKFEGFEQKVGPVSTISGATIINAIIVQTVSELLDEGITPPVFVSGNLDKGKEHNDKIFEVYRDVIKYMPYT